MKTDSVYLVGDVMYDIFKKFEHQFSDDNLYGEYCLLTMHRAENTIKGVLSKRIGQISELDIKVVYPMHPRTKKFLKDYSIAIPANVLLIEPVGWLKLMGLIKHAQFVLTDSGGLQKEAFWQGKQCFTLRDETEWIETLNQKANTLVGVNDYINLLNDNKSDFSNPYGSGFTSEMIVNTISPN